MIGLVKRLGGVLTILAALAASGASIALAASSSPTAPITPAEASSFAQAVNLQASDLPGSTPLPTQPPTSPSTERQGCPATISRDRVGSGASVLSDRDDIVGSAVVVTPSEAMAQAKMATLTSRHGRACLARSLGEIVGVEGEGDRRIASHTVRTTFIPISTIVGPESVALHVLAEFPPVEEQRTRRPHMLHKKLPKSKATFIHAGAAIFRVGSAEILFISFGPHDVLPASTEDRLLTLLHTRAEEHKL